MSYFDCEHGSRYHPFGQGGRDVILRSLSGGLAKTSTSLQTCPYHAFPLLASIGQVDAHIDKEVTKDGQTDTQTCGHTHADGQSCGSTDAQARVYTQEANRPIVLREPDSEVSRLFDALSKDVICEILKVHAAALMVSM